MLVLLNWQIFIILKSKPNFWDHEVDYHYCPLINTNQIFMIMIRWGMERKNPSKITMISKVGQKKRKKWKRQIQLRSLLVSNQPICNAFWFCAHFSFSPFFLFLGWKSYERRPNKVKLILYNVLALSQWGDCFWHA